MIVELPDEMVQRWFAGKGNEGDDQIILAAIHRARTEPTIAELYSILPESVHDLDRILSDPYAKYDDHPLPPPVWEGTRMNQQGRDELRYLHRPCEFCVDLGDDCGGCETCDVDDYPCDTIKVLDAWEEWLNSHTQITPPVDTQEKVTATGVTLSECDHEWLGRAGAGHRWIAFTDCPKCGEKL